MTDNTINAIKSLLAADPEAATNPAQISVILSACRHTAARRKLLNAREACLLLGVSRPTLSKLVAAGRLVQVRLTPRKSRFYEDELLALVYSETGTAKDC